MTRFSAFRIVLSVFVAGLLAALLASYAGRFHPLGDSLAVFRPAMAALLALCALAFRRGWRLALLGVALVALLPILWMMRPVPAPDPASEAGPVVYQKNLLFRRPDPAELLADFRASGADLILLEELSDANMPIPDAMRGSHPYQLICPAHRVGAVAILSVHPLADHQCREGSGFAMARVQHPSGAFTAVALHLHWPWPHGQPAQLDAIMGDLGRAPRPMVIGGDFNMIPWAGAPRRIAGATDTRIVGPLFATFSLRGYPLPIDHVLVDTGTKAAVTRRARLGSDHFGVLARIGAFGGS